MNVIECVNNTPTSKQIVESKFVNNCPEFSKKEHQGNKKEESLKARNINLEEPTPYQIWNLEQEYKKIRKKISDNYTEDAKLTLVKMSLIHGLQATCKRFKLSFYSIERWRQKFNINIASLADRLSKSNEQKKYPEATKMQLAKSSLDEGINKTCKKYDIDYKALKSWRTKFRKINNIANLTNRIMKKKAYMKLKEISEWMKDKKNVKQRKRNTYLAETRKNVAGIAMKIGVSNASKRFNIPPTSVERWVQARESPSLNITPNKRKPCTFDIYPPAFRIMVAKEACGMGQRKAGKAFNIGLSTLEKWVPAYKNLGFDELIDAHKLNFRDSGVSIKSLGNDVVTHVRDKDKESLENSSEFNSNTSIVSPEVITCTSMKRECSDKGEEGPMEEDVENKADQILNLPLCKAKMKYEGNAKEAKLTKLQSQLDPKTKGDTSYLVARPELHLSEELEEDEKVHISPELKLQIVKKLLRKEKSKDFNELAGAYAIDNRILLLWLDHYNSFGEHAIIFKQDENITDPNKFSIREIIHIVELSLFKKSYLEKTCLDNNLLQSWLKTYFKFDTSDGKWKAPSEIEISIFEEIQKNQLGNSYNQNANNINEEKDLKYYSPSTKLGIAKMGELKGVTTTSKKYGIGEYIVREWFELFQAKGQSAFNSG